MSSQTCVNLNAEYNGSITLDSRDLQFHVLELPIQLRWTTTIIKWGTYRVVLEQLHALDVQHLLHV